MGMGNLYSETEGRPAWMRVARKTENSQLKHNWVEISRYILHTPLLTLSHSRCDCTQPATSQPATTSDDGASAGWSTTSPAPTHLRERKRNQTASCDLVCVSRVNANPNDSRIEWNWRAAARLQRCGKKFAIERRSFSIDMKSGFSFLTRHILLAAGRKSSVTISDQRDWRMFYVPLSSMCKTPKISSRKKGPPWLDFDLDFVLTELGHFQVGCFSSQKKTKTFCMYCVFFPDRRALEKICRHCAAESPDPLPFISLNEITRDWFDSHLAKPRKNGGVMPVRLDRISWTRLTFLIFSSSPRSSFSLTRHDH
jgi:hypothetical protein